MVSTRTASFSITCPSLTSSEMVLLLTEHAFIHVQLAMTVVDLTQSNHGAFLTTLRGNILMFKKSPLPTSCVSCTDRSQFSPEWFVFPFTEIIRVGRKSNGTGRRDKFFKHLFGRCYYLPFARESAVADSQIVYLSHVCVLSTFLSVRFHFWCDTDDQTYHPIDIR